MQYSPVFDTYRVEIVDVSAGSRPLWSAAGLRGGSDIPILVQRSFFKPGRYQVVLYGVSGGREERIATHGLRVPAR
jgi:hypothetical protein